MPVERTTTAEMTTPAERTTTAEMTTPAEDTISVVIATKDAAGFLPGCLDSVVSQSEAPVEIIVVDADSGDATRHIADSYPDTTVVRQSGRGLWQAWNQGIDLARGTCIAIIDSDDIWRPDALARLLAGLRTEPAAAACIGRVRFFLDAPTVPAGFRPHLLHGDHTAHMQGGALVRREVFDSVGRYPEDLPTGSDIQWFHLLRTSGLPLRYIDDVVLEKRVHGGNLSSTFDSGPDLLRIARESIVRRRTANRERV